MRGWLLILLLLLFFAVKVEAGSVTLAWDASPDGAAVVGYKIYMGPTSGSYTNSYTVGNVLVATITGLSISNTYFFAATAYAADGTESDFSNEVSYTVPAPVLKPRPASNLQVVH